MYTFEAPRNCFLSEPSPGNQASLTKEIILPPHGASTLRPRARETRVLSISHWPRKKVTMLICV